jgi:hypothetical protein
VGGGTQLGATPNFSMTKRQNKGDCFIRRSLDVVVSARSASMFDANEVTSTAGLKRFERADQQHIYWRVCDRSRYDREVIHPHRAREVGAGWRISDASKDRLQISRLRSSFSRRKQLLPWRGTEVVGEAEGPNHEGILAVSYAVRDREVANLAR